jgi:hypothetical protein
MVNKTAYSLVEKKDEKNFVENEYILVDSMENRKDLLLGNEKDVKKETRMVVLMVDWLGKG